MSKPLISLVTGTYNRIEHLSAMIDSFVQQMPRGTAYEIIVVDGGSNDGTQTYIESLPNVTLIAGDLGGAIKAFNTGAAAASGHYVMLANDDVTFATNSIIPAIMHLQSHPRCGAVAFADNRPKDERHSHLQTQHYSIAYIRTAADDAGFQKPVPYAQVGLFRREIGNRLNWWGYGEIDAHTYGGDTLLSTRIWESGYTVDAVIECKVHDSILEDELRQRGREFIDEGYYQLYPQGFHIPDEPQFDIGKTETLRFAYLPIFENHPIQQQQKRGLRDALNNVGWCWELDYNNHPDPHGALVEILRTMQPHIVLTQFHGADKVTLGLANLIKQHAPKSIFVNWNGDYWPQGLTSPEALQLLRHVDLQLTVNADVLELYEQEGIPAAYWQVSFEPVENLHFKDEISPDWASIGPIVNTDIVMLGNRNDAHGGRARIEQLVKELYHERGIHYMLYGQGWEHPYGDTMYNFAANRAIYANSRVAISDTIPGSNGFVSDRFFQIVSASGAICLQQHIKNFEQFTGYKAGLHYIEWHNLDELETVLVAVLEDDELRQKIVRNAHKFTHEHHSFEARVAELLDVLIPEKASRNIGDRVLLMNVAASRGGGIRGGYTNKIYQYEPGKAFECDGRDARLILRTYPEVFVEVER